MRRILLLVLLLSLIPVGVFAQTGAADEEPAPSIGLLALLGISPADFGLGEPPPVTLPAPLLALQESAADELALLASIPQSRTADGAFVLGDPSAPITIIEFADWACPHCQDYRPTIDQMIRDYVVTGQAAFEFRIFPTAGRELTQQNGALAVCLEEQVPGAFWAAYVYLFGLLEADSYNQASSILPQLVGAEAGAALDCVNGAGLAQISADVNYGISNGVSGTPAVLVRYAGSETPEFIIFNEERFSSGGVPGDVLAAVIEAAQ